MELYQLRVFKAIAESGNMTRCAEGLHITQSSLSKTLAALETGLGAKLFDRRGGRLYLNATGQRFFRRVDRILSELDDAAGEASAADRGVISLGVSASGLVTRVIDDFIRDNPAVRIDQRVLPQKQIVKLLENGEIDLAVTTADISSEQISWRRLADERLLLLVHRKNPLAGEKSVPLSAAADMPFAISDSVEKDCEDMFAKAGFEPKILFCGSEPEMILRMVSYGRAVTLLSSAVYSWKMAAEVIDEPLKYIRAIELSDPGSLRRLGAAVSVGHYLPPTCRSFLSSLEGYFSK